MPITSFEQANAALRQYYRHSQTRPMSLQAMRELLAHVGNPQDELRTVHVAGTSGKTSTAYYAAALLQQAGAMVGLTVSPHVDQVNERVQINLVPLAESVFCSELEVFLALVAGSGLQPSYFEVMVAFAYWEFRRQGVDYAVVEVGLGGLLDGTNVIERPDKICVITDIGLDHTEILGDTLEAIAAQKAGIIKPGNQVFMYRQSAGVVQVVMQAARRAQATVALVEPQVIAASENLPQFQRRNFGLATASVTWLLARDGRPALDPEALKEAARTLIPARMEQRQCKGKVIIIDGAHNAQKLTALFAAIAERYPDASIGALIAFVAADERRLHDALAVIAERVQHVIVTGFYSEKDYQRASFEPEYVATQLQRLGGPPVRIVANAGAALDALLAQPDDVLLVCGSFYLMNHVRPLLERKP